MGLFDFLKIQRRSRVQTWQEVGRYNAHFYAFGGDAYKSAAVRACVRPLAEFTSKAEARCKDEQLQRLLNYRPNRYMNGRDFLYKIRTRLELTNTVMIYIERDEAGKVVSLYPVPFRYFEAIEYQNGLFIKFGFSDGRPEVTLPWEDIAILRRDYNRSDIAGDANEAILDTLETLNTADQGLAHSIKSSANLRGILKSTKSMLAPEEIKKQKEEFVRDYMSLENEGGIASLDSTQEFTPINMAPLTASADQRNSIREDVQRYFGVSDKVITGDMTPDEIQVFYEIHIEPFLARLSTELTSKIYPGRRGAYTNNWIVYEANKLQFVSITTKIQMFKEVVLYGGMTVNEWREGCNMSPLEGGDRLIMRKDAGYVGENEEEEDGTDEGNESV